MRLLLFFCLCMCWSAGIAQNNSTVGKEFYVSFCKVITSSTSGPVTATLFLTGSKNTTGIVQNPNTGFSKNFSVTAGSITAVSVPLSEIVNDSAGIKNLGVFIQAQDSITAYGLTGTGANSDAATLIPVSSLGTEYLVASYRTASANSASYFLIVATQDSTEVIITPSNHLSSGQDSGQSFSVMLNRGQSYYATHRSGTGKRDLSGSRISVKNPCKTIAVFSGSELTYIPSLYPAGDLLLEQLFPIPSFGKQFITPVFRGRNVCRIKVYAAYDNTEVIVSNGTIIKILNANEALEFETSALNPASITTSQPAEVAAFAVGQDYDKLFGPANEGDPTMMMIPPIEQNLKESVFSSPVIGVIKSHKLCVFTKTIDAQKTTLDNQNVGSSFKPVDDNPLYSFATFDVLAGQHVIRNDGGFLAYSYGFGNYQGYGYCSGSNAKNIETYIQLNGITSLSNDTADACIKDVRFEIIAAIPDSAYAWDFGDGSPIIHTAGNQIFQQHNYQIPGVYEVKLTRYKFGDPGCNIVGSVSILPVKVANLVTPTVKVIAVPSTPVCQGTPITFVAEGTGGGATPVYQWQVNGMNAGANTPTFSSSTLQPNDKVTCIFTSSISCSNPAQVSTAITANVYPTLSPTVSITTLTDSLCTAVPTTFSATTNITNWPLIFQWKVNGKNAGTNAAQFTYVPANDDEILCEISVTDSCNQYRATSNKIKMTVAENFPKPTITISTPAATICDANTATFTATITNAGSNPVYEWWVNNQPTGNFSASFSGSNLKNGDIIKSSVTTTGWCPTTSTSNTIALSVLPLLTPGIEISSPSPSVCQGESISFLATATNGGSNPSFQWQVNGVNTGVTTNSFNTGNLHNNDIVTCVLVANNLCQTTSSATSKPIVVSIKPITTPTVVITPSKNPICKGEQVIFKAIETNAGTGFKYQWNLNGNDLPDETSSLFTSSSLSNGDKITCKIISGERCTNNAVSNEIVMIVHPLPAVIFNPDEVVIYAGTSFKLSPLITGDIAVYRWTPSSYLDDPRLANPIATPEYDQLYTLNVSTAFGCKASSDFLVKVFREVIMPNAFTPNGDGVNDIFRIPPMRQSVRLEYLIVYNRWGEKVFESKDANKGWDGKLKGVAQPSGNYVWICEYENPVTGQSKLIKGSVVLIR